MMKRMLAMILCAMLLFCGGCGTGNQAVDSVISNLTGGSDESEGESGGGGNAYEDEATKVSADTAYFNEYLGVSFTVPAGWWLYDINAENFSETAGETADVTSLDVSHYEEGAAYLYMISCANLQFSSRDNHIGIDIDAEKLDGVETLADYIGYHEAYMLEPFEDGTAYILHESSQTNIGGTDFEQRIYEVPQEGAPYKIVALTCAVRDGYFLTVQASYWDANPDALDNIMGLMEDQLELSAMSI